jgi:hypothetical protein
MKQEMFSELLFDDERILAAMTQEKSPKHQMAKSKMSLKLFVKTIVLVTVIAFVFGI